MSQYNKRIYLNVQVNIINISLKIKKCTFRVQIAKSKRSEKTPKKNQQNDKN